MGYLFGNNPASLVADFVSPPDNQTKVVYPIEQNGILVRLVDHQNNPASNRVWPYKTRGESSLCYVDFVVSGVNVASRKLRFGSNLLIFSDDELTCIWSMLRFILPENRENIDFASMNFWLPVGQRCIVAKGYLKYEAEINQQ